MKKYNGILQMIYVCMIISFCILFSDSAYAAMPSAYSAVDEGYGTSVKDQLDYGTCWAHSTIASIEASMIREGIASSSVNLSELSLVYYAFNRPVDEFGNTANDTINLKNGSYLTSGGNNYLAVFTLAQGFGITSENNIPYSKASETLKLDKSKAYSNQAGYFEDAYIMNMSDRDDVKNNILEHGAVGVSIYNNSSYYSNTFKSYYCSKMMKGCNHSIAIVGWNDNYDATHFVNKAPGNGAWLCKNSWGTSYGNEGYVWISYYDVMLNQEIAAAYNYSTDKYYDHIYQYDGTCGVKFYTNVLRAANVFTTKNDEEITAVRIAVMAKDVKYDISIYTDLKSAEPDSGRLVTRQTGNLRYKGYQTVKLDKTVKIPKGEKFSIVVKMTNDGSKSPVLIDYDTDWDNVEFTGRANNGESFIGITDYTWTDISEEDANCRIKAITKETDIESATVIDSFVSEYEGPDYIGTSVRFKVKAHNEISNLSYRFTISDKSGTEKVISDYSSKNYADVIVKEAGSYKLNAYVKDKYGKIKKTSVIHEFKHPDFIADVVFSKESPQVLGTVVKIDTIAYENDADDIFDDVDSEITVSDELYLGNDASVNKEVDRNRLLYRYVITDASGKQIYVRDYLPKQEFEWKTDTAGEYTIGISVKNTEGVVETIYRKYTVYSPLSVTIKQSLKSPQLNNSTIVFDAVATGGQADYQYRFYVNDKVVRDYTSDSKLTYSFKNVGTYTIKAIIKDSVGNSATKSIKYVIFRSLYVSGVTTSIKSPQLYTKKVTITPVVKYGSGTVYYRYVIKNSGGKSVADTGYVAEKKSYTWTPKTYGTYNVFCFATNDKKIVVMKQFKYYAYRPLKMNSVITKTVKQKNRTLKISCKAGYTGGSGAYQYQFIIKNSAKKQIFKKSYSTKNECVFAPSTNGTYYIYCYVKDSKGSIVDTVKKINVKSAVKIESISAKVISKKDNVRKVSIVSDVSGGLNSYKMKYVIQNANGKTIKSSKYVANRCIQLNITSAGRYKVTCYLKDKTGKVVKKVKYFNISK